MYIFILKYLKIIHSQGESLVKINFDFNFKDCKKESYKNVKTNFSLGIAFNLPSLWRIDRFLEILDRLRNMFVNSYSITLD